MVATSADKRALRERLLELRRQLPQAVRARASQQAARNLLTLPELATATTALLYAATPTETDPALATRELSDRGVRVLLPRVAGADLEAVPAADLQALPAGPLGVPEPTGPAVPVGDIDVVVLPGVAFDRTGTRLGRGGGHYDRLLARLPRRSLRVGLCFAVQLVAGVPREPHDRRVEVVVTEEEVVRVTGEVAGSGPTPHTPV